MKKLNRRKFLALAGASSAAVTTGGAITLAELGQTKGKTLTFRAVTGMPSHSLPAYASYVIEGHVNLASRSGVVTQTLYAGGPEVMTKIAFPGQSRIIRVTDTQDLGGVFRITGVVHAPSQLRYGESSTFDMLIDPSQRIARTKLAGSELVMDLEM